MPDFVDRRRSGAISVAQAQSFDVAIVKPGDPRSGVSSGVGYPSPKAFQTTGSLQTLIMLAWGLQASQISCGPKWLASDIFDIEAQSDAPASPDRKLKMLQALLTERFNMALHTEKKELPIFALVVDRNGPKLQEATDGKTGSSRGAAFVRGQLTMAELVACLAPILGRTVQDKTGLTGTWIVRLEWAPNDDSTAPSLFTAVREQLGLRLEPARSPVDVLVIERAGKPSEN